MDMNDHEFSKRVRELTGHSTNEGALRELEDVARIARENAAKQDTPDPDANRADG